MLAAATLGQQDRGLMSQPGAHEHRLFRSEAILLSMKIVICVCGVDPSVAKFIGMRWRFFHRDC